MGRQDDDLIAANSVNEDFIKSTLALGRNFVERKRPVVLTTKANALHFENVDEAKVNEISSLSDSRAKDMWSLNTVQLNKIKLSLAQFK